MGMQEDVFVWCKQTFVGQSIEGKLAHLWEELHEAFAASVTFKEQEELADCALLTMEIASLSGVTLKEPSVQFAAIIRWKFDKCKQRDWQTPDERGIFHHQKEVQQS